MLLALLGENLFAKSVVYVLQTHTLYQLDYDWFGMSSCSSLPNRKKSICEALFLIFCQIHQIQIFKCHLKFAKISRLQRSCAAC